MGRRVPDSDAPACVGSFAKWEIPVGYSQGNVTDVRLSICCLCFAGLVIGVRHASMREFVGVWGHMHYLIQLCVCVCVRVHA